MEPKMSIFFFQFNVMAKDNGVPPKNRTVGIYIRFIRDRMTRIDNLPREEKVSENVQNNSIVYTVTGRDDDRQVRERRKCHRM